MGGAEEGWVGPRRDPADPMPRATPPITLTLTLRKEAGKTGLSSSHNPVPESSHPKRPVRGLEALLVWHVPGRIVLLVLFKCRSPGSLILFHARLCTCEKE